MPSSGSKDTFGSWHEKIPHPVRLAVKVLHVLAEADAAAQVHLHVLQAVGQAVDGLVVEGENLSMMMIDKKK